MKHALFSWQISAYLYFLKPEVDRTGLPGVGTHAGWHQSSCIQKDVRKPQTVPPYTVMCSPLHVYVSRSVI